MRAVCHLTRPGDGDAVSAAQFLHDYWVIQVDPSHLLSEFGFELAQLAVVAVLWRRFLRPRFFRRLHDDIDAEHGVTHNESEKAR